MCADLVARVPSVLQAALDAAANSPASVASALSDIREVIVFGGGSRIPIMQLAILSATKMETLGKNVNSDEAAAMGAIYQAASNTRGFLVKKVVLRGSNRYPLAVTLPRFSADNGTDFVEGELVTRLLFPAGNLFPQKRNIKFPRPQKDIFFQVHYGEASENLSRLVSDNFSTEICIWSHKFYRSLFLSSRYLNGAEAVMNVSISNVNSVMEKFEESGHSPQAVKTHLELDASGILQLSEVNLIMVHGGPENKSNGTPSTLKKFADGISNLFGSGDSKAMGDKVNLPDVLEQSNGSNETLIHPLPFHVQILDLVSPPVESVGASMAMYVVLRSFSPSLKASVWLVFVYDVVVASIHSALFSLAFGNSSRKICQAERLPLLLAKIFPPNQKNRWIAVERVICY
ncbi:unnamed protein product [Hydatigera taeniaeformis]|uniref:Hypoxia up-regulated protein 1 n=1 Tax=Hydatigena taeniaeformis TaxID=6205 RepID=A0A0R3XAK7_HYDTA|nr:unnamed protein product [Hydatigera taeniaeformis]